MTLEQKPCEDCISRSSIKQKLKEHHDFFVKAYGGFSNLPQHDKSRVDEISNCIAMVINEPPVEPAKNVGHWIHHEEKRFVSIEHWECSRCHRTTMTYPFCVNGNDYNAMYYCPKCGVKMIEKEVSNDKSC